MASPRPRRWVLFGIGAVYGLHDIIGVGPAGVLVVMGAIASVLTAASFSRRSVFLLSHPGAVMNESPVPSIDQK